MLAVLSGSGTYGLGKLKEEYSTMTPYGDAIVNIVSVGKKEILFVPRHGKNHVHPPHKIGYRANIFALNKLGATAVLGTYACGVISKFKVGDIVLLKDFIGMEMPITFFDDFSSGIRHTDFTEPFDKRLSKLVEESAAIHRITLKKGGVIKTTCGPRFETKAEISMYKKLGINLVSMTAAHEIILMKEMEIPFVGLGIGTNLACGIGKRPLSHKEVVDLMEKKNGQLELIVKELAIFITD